MLLTRQFKGTKVTQVLPIHTSTTEYVNDIIHQSCSVTLSRRWNEPDTIQLQPHLRCSIEDLGIIVVVLTVSAAEPIGGEILSALKPWYDRENLQNELFAVCDADMTCPLRRLG